MKSGRGFAEGGARMRGCRQEMGGGCDAVAEAAVAAAVAATTAPVRPRCAAYDSSIQLSPIKVKTTCHILWLRILKETMCQNCVQ